MFIDTRSLGYLRKKRNVKSKALGDMVFPGVKSAKFWF